jgi:hypothetical protein
MQRVMIGLQGVHPTDRTLKASQISMLFAEVAAVSFDCAVWQA